MRTHLGWNIGTRSCPADSRVMMEVRTQASQFIWCPLTRRWQLTQHGHRVRFWHLTTDVTASLHDSHSNDWEGPSLPKTKNPQNKTAWVFSSCSGSLSFWHKEKKTKKKCLPCYCKWCCLYLYANCFESPAGQSRISQQPCFPGVQSQTLSSLLLTGNRGQWGIDALPYICISLSSCVWSTGYMGDKSHRWERAAACRCICIFRSRALMVLDTRQGRVWSWGFSCDLKGSS